MKIQIENAKSVECLREDRKSLSIRVFPDLSVVVKAPLKASDENILAFVQKKNRWLNKQLNYFNQFIKAPEAEIQSGKSMLYLGRQYQLVIQKCPLKNVVKVEKNKIVVLSSNPENTLEIKKALDTWLLTRAQKVFDEQLKNCLKAFPQLETPSLKIRKLNKRWGSYLKKHEIILNPQLLQASKSAINYVITHELCHFYHKDHDADFYNLLTSKVPNWRDIEKNLELKLLAK